MVHYYFNNTPNPPMGDAIAIRKAIGSSIGRARQTAGLTQEDVAERLGIGPEAVSRLERGVGSITAERLVILGDMFGCRSDQLLLGASARQDDQGAAIVQLIEDLDLEDRRFILETVERLAERLRHSRPASNIKKR